MDFEASQAIALSTLAPDHPVARLPEHWQERAEAWGEAAYRGKQVFTWIHARGVFDPDQMTDLPQKLRQRMKVEGLSNPLRLGSAVQSKDGTRKLVLELADGTAIETVLIPSADGTMSQCISTQVGCAMGCVFCASGQAGLQRHMSVAEIVAQVILARTLLGADGVKVARVVLMGMGEPLHNYAAVAAALRLMMHERGLNLSGGRITLSTSGLVPQIDRLAADFGGQVQLAVSMHAADDDKRSALLPVNRRYPLHELLAAMRRYPVKPRQHITVEYTLVGGQNDSIGDARKLAKLLQGMAVKVNLIPMNPIAASELAAPAPSQVQAFETELRRHGIATYIRRTLGDDVDAACGQLALLRKAPSRATKGRGEPAKL